MPFVLPIRTQLIDDLPPQLEPRYLRLHTKTCITEHSPLQCTHIISLNLSADTVRWVGSSPYELIERCHMVRGEKRGCGFPSRNPMALKPYAVPGKKEGTFTLQVWCR
jgi:hypothetical protein